MKFTKVGLHFSIAIVLSALFSLGLGQTAILGQSVTSALTFKNISINDGLSQNVTRAIVQDHDGFIWIATKNGLNRYDGFEFESFFNDPFDTMSLSGNDIISLHIDQAGVLWVGTTTGLNRHNRSTGTFTHITFPACDHVKFPDHITEIQEDKAGQLWLAHVGGGLSIISKDGQLISTSTSLCENNFFDREIKCFYSDDDFMWIGTEEGLLKINIHDWTQLFYPIISNKEKSFELSRDSMVSAITPGAEPDHLWLGKVGGIALFNIKTEEHTLFQDSIMKSLGYEHRINHIIHDDELNSLWLSGTLGLNTFDIRKQQFIRHPYADENLKGESSGNVTSIFKSNDGCIWLSTNGYGVDIYSPTKNKFNLFSCTSCKHELTGIWGFSTRTIFEDREGTTWVSSNALYKWNRNTNLIKSYRQLHLTSIEFGNTQVWSISQDKQGMLWMATWEGLYQYDAANDVAIRYYHDPTDRSGLPEKVVYETFIDSKSNLWALTNSFICLFNPTTKTFTNYKIGDRISPQVNNYITVVEHNALFYIGTGLGLLQFNPTSGAKKWYQYQASNPNGLSNNNIKSLCLDNNQPDKILWIGTAGGGLNKFDFEEESFVHYNTSDGLPDNVVYGVLQDDTDHLWMSTNKGLSKFDPEKETFTNFDVEDGLQSNEFNSGSYFKSNSGELFFGGLKGVNYFYPEQVSLSDFEPNVAITSFSIEDQNLNPEGTSLSYSELRNQENQISLKHDENVFQFTFSALDYNDHDANQYQYMLEGWDKNFIQSQNKRSAIYSNVSNGNYTFRVRGSNSDGKWSPKEATLSITIHPPWWRSDLAKIFYGLIAIILGLYFRREHLNRLKLKNELALEHLQTEKLKELDEIKTRFFSNVSHEFRTPLTVILSPLDDLMKTTNNSKSVQTIKRVKANASRLLELVNQLMDLSKIQDNKFKLNLVNQPLEHFIKHICDSFQPVAEQKSITFHTRSTLGEQLVPFDRDGVEKIITNLLSNAFKFTSNNGNIWVDSNIINQSDEQFVQLTVTDDGAGISKKELAHIFDRFFQSDENNDHAMGTGIGLSLVKELVDLHGGEINVTSQLGQGSTFTVLIPMKTSSPTIQSDKSQNWLRAVPEIRQTAQVISSVLDSTKIEHPDDLPIILIVDDNEDIRQLIADTLGEQYMRYQAADGNAGLSQALDIVPDLIVSDIMMPGMDGYELCHHLKGNTITSHIPIILLTAKASRHSKLDGLKLGADAYLTKPFDTEELRIRVENLIQSRSALKVKYAENKSWETVWQDLPTSDQSFVESLNTYLDKHISNPDLSIQEIAQTMTIGERQLRRKMKALTSQSPNQYLRSYRLHQAGKILLTQKQDIAEIAFDVGFSSPAYFSKCFKDEFGKTAREFIDAHRAQGRSDN